MSKYHLEFTLKQHTPLIHFQHDQDGATLRATELKPKLDRFILTKLGNGNYDTGRQIAKNNGWLTGNGEHPALDYKVRIEAPKNVSYYLPLARKLNTTNFQHRENNLKREFSFDFTYIHNSPFFANEDKFKWNGNFIDPQEKKKLKEVRFAVYTNENINGEIKSFNTNEINGKTLLKTIEETLPDFFLSTNFGTRQNKGFGSFTVTSINQQPVSFNERDFRNIFQFTYRNTNRFNDFERIFSSIQHDYQILKAGINFNGYKKSLLFLYFVQQNPPVRWEKRKIKQQIHNNPFIIEINNNDFKVDLKTRNKNSAVYDAKGNQRWDDPHPFIYKYIRALLGLAENFEFQVILDPYPNKGRIPKLSYIVEVKHDEIDRFQSPLFFKVVNNKVYLLANDINEDILAKEFQFTLRLKRNGRIVNDRRFRRELENLLTPESFNIGDFLEFAIQNCDCNERLSNYQII